MNEPVIIGVEPDEDYISPTVDFELAAAYYQALFVDWMDADIILDKLGVPLQAEDGTLMPMSDRILKAVENAERRTS